MPGMDQDQMNWDKPTSRRISDGLSAPGSSIKPITPAEVAKQKVAGIPPLVIDVFNQLIAQKFTARSAKITQDEVISSIIQRMSTGRAEITRQYIFDQGWLNVEEIYREYDWNVEYHKPDYTENFPAYFIFSLA